MKTLKVTLTVQITDGYPITERSLRDLFVDLELPDAEGFERDDDSGYVEVVDIEHEVLS